MANRRHKSERQKLYTLLGELIGQEKALLSKLISGRDATIRSLYMCLGLPPKPERRSEQMAVGSVVWRVNCKLKPLGYKIKPGIARATYRLYQTDEE